MATALITGGTVGIGLGFARRLASRGHDLILVARDGDRLAQVARDIEDASGRSVRTVVADLADREDVDRVAELLADPASPVEYLVNNAGFGIREGFLDSSLDAEQRLLDVMVTAPMRLCRAALPGMVRRGSGTVVNVSSIAGWLAGGTYSAAKAWATTFTEGLARELHGTGVTATAVCPGLTHTQFHQRADMDVSRIPEWMWLDVDEVVDRALSDAAKGRAISVAGRQYRVLSLATQYAPRPLIRRFGRPKR
jgi:hypothetical protein